MTYAETLDEAWASLKKRRGKNAPTVISTFAGAGGSSMGYGMAGFKELLSTDWGEHSCDCLRENKIGKIIVHTDIAELTVEDVLQQCDLAPGDLDVLDGSPPCQGFSTIGKRVVDDPRNSLFKEFVRLLNGLQPKAFVMENVSGMVKGDMKLIFAEILCELRAQGYQVKAWVLNAKWFGVPQMRQRTIFIGYRNGLNIEPRPPEPTTTRLISIAEACEFEGIEARCVYRDDRTTSLIHLNYPALTITASGISNYWMREYYVRVRKGARSKFMPGPIRLSPKTKRRLRGGDGYRRFSIGEVMRLQSFLDQYQWPEGTDWQTGWARIGNSVPPLFMRAIADQVRADLKTV